MAFREEGVTKRLRFVGCDQLFEELALFRKSIVKRQVDRGFDPFDASVGRALIAGLACDLLAHRVENAGIVFGFCKFRVVIAHAGERAHIRDFLRIGDGGIEKAVVRIDVVENAEILTGARRVMFTANDHIERGLHASETGYALGAAGAGNNPNGDFRLADLRGLRGNSIVAQHGGLEPAAKRVSLDRGDDRFFTHFHRLPPFGRCRIAFAHLLDVGTGDEFAALSDQHHRFDIRVRVALGDAFRHAFRHAGAQRIDGRIVDGDDADGASLLKANEFGHMNSPEMKFLASGGTGFN